jgi:hypothetical protein
MADLTDLQAAQTVKIAGSDSSGIETGYIKSTLNGDIQSADTLVSGGVYGSIVVGTSAVEVKVGGSRYANRKLVTLDNTSNVVIYWGYNNSITTSSYAGRIFKDQQVMWAASDAVAIWIITGSASNTVRISEGA